MQDLTHAHAWIAACPRKNYCKGTQELVHGHAQKNALLMLFHQHQEGIVLSKGNMRCYPRYSRHLLHENHQILAGAPENLRIGDTQSILLVGITNQGITA